MKNRVVLIQPRVGYFEDLRDRPVAPLGVLAAASVAAQTREVVVLDERVEPDLARRLDAELNERTLLVGLSAYSGPTIGRALDLARQVRTRVDAPIVWGGAHPSLAPEQTLTHPLVDYVIQGEGEWALAALADALAAGDPYPGGVPGLWIKPGGVPTCSAPPVALDLSALPPTPYHLVDPARYVQWFHGHTYLAVQATRGCPNRCTYCFNRGLASGRFRARPVEAVLDEIAAVRRRVAFDGAYFVDDNLFRLAKKKLFELAEGLARQGLLWHMQGADAVALRRFTADEFAELHRLGLQRFNIGVESGSARMRDLLGKHEDLDVVRDVVRTLRGIPITVVCNYIFNLPTETLDDLRQSVRFIDELRALNPLVLNDVFNKFLAFPNTPIAAHFPDLLQFPTDLDGWARVSWETRTSPVYADYLRDPDLFAGVVITSLLADDKADYYIRSALLRRLASLYRPIAAYRLRHLDFRAPLDIRLANRLLGIVP